MTRSIASERNQFAYQVVKNWDPTLRADATTLAKGLPIQVRSQGLGTVIAWLMTRSTSDLAARNLLNILGSWLLHSSPRSPFAREEDDGRNAGEKLLEAWMNADRPEAMAAQRDAMGMLEQLKVFAEAFASTTTQT